MLFVSIRDKRNVAFKMCMEHQCCKYLLHSDVHISHMPFAISLMFAAEDADFLLLTPITVTK
jgi:hypothetical protein